MLERRLFGVCCLNHAAQSSASGKLTRYLGPSRTAGANNVFENAVDRILIEYADISVGMNIHFEGFELQAMLIRFIVESNRSKIWQIGLRADGRILGNYDCNFVSCVLVWEGFNIG